MSNRDRRHLQPAALRTNVGPAVVIFGDRAVAQYVLSALPKAHSLRSPNQLQADPLPALAILCGSCDQLMRMVAMEVRPPFWWVGALRRQSSRAAAQLLTAGAQDVISCEMARPELTARIEAALSRRNRGSAFNDDWAVLTACRPTQMRLYEYLRENSGRVVSQSELIECVFGGAHAEDTSLVRVHVAGLRKTLGPNGIRIQTLRGQGYRYVDSSLVTARPPERLPPDHRGGPTDSTVAGKHVT